MRAMARARDRLGVRVRVMVRVRGEELARVLMHGQGARAEKAGQAWLGLE